jgi:hypothetical protein
MFHSVKARSERTKGKGLGGGDAREVDRNAAAAANNKIACLSHQQKETKAHRQAARRQWG